MIGDTEEKEKRRIAVFPPIQKIPPRMTRHDLKTVHDTGVILPKPTSRMISVVKRGGVNSKCSKNAKKS